jgi:DNA repair protein RadC
MKQKQTMTKGSAHRRIDRKYSVRRGLEALSPADRPREKLERAGHSALGDNELLALVLGHGTRGRSALEMGTELLASVGGIHGLARTSVGRIAEGSGFGPALAGRVVAAVELGRRTLERQPEKRRHIGSPRELAAYLMPRYGAFPVERFGLVLVDARHQIMRVRVMAVGSLDAVVANPRDVFREALLGEATGIVAFHNHPTGDPTPSPDDVSLTHRLISAGKVVGIDMIDHIILGDSSYFSMREANRVG